MDPAKAPSMYLAWADEVKIKLTMTRSPDLWKKALRAKMEGGAAAVARWTFNNEHGEEWDEKELKRRLLRGVYGEGAWLEVVEIEWEETKLG